jgi:hypothetical protein
MYTAKMDSDIDLNMEYPIQSSSPDPPLPSPVLFYIRSQDNTRHISLRATQLQPQLLGKYLDTFLILLFDSK